MTLNAPLSPTGILTRDHAISTATMSPIREKLHRKCTAPSPTSPGESYLPQATEIIPHLYISDLFTATDTQFLASHRITHRLSVLLEPESIDCTAGDPLASSKEYEGFTLKTKCITLADKSDAKLWMYLDAGADWIHDSLEGYPNAKVLVHCNWGKSRSVAMVLAYLMKRKGLTLDGALAYVQSKRCIAQPNEGFMRQLKAYEGGIRR